MAAKSVPSGPGASRTASATSTARPRTGSLADAGPDGCGEAVGAPAIGDAPFGEAGGGIADGDGSDVDGVDCGLARGGDGLAGDEHAIARRPATIVVPTRVGVVRIRWAPDGTWRGGAWAVPRWHATVRASPCISTFDDGRQVVVNE